MLSKFITWKITSVTMIALISFEFILRFFGFADTPILISDPEIEYYSQPKKCYTRYRNRICYNSLGMRSDEFSSEFDKTYLVIGDSVVNGGALTDQSETITSYIQSEIGKYKIQANVMNASAGSWGPRNQLNFLKRFAKFRSDRSVIIISSHDITDLPNYSIPVNDSEKANFAIQEFFERAIFDQLRRYTYPPTPQSTLTDDMRTIGMRDFTELVSHVCNNSSKVAIMMHPSEHELSAKKWDEKDFESFVNSFQIKFCRPRVVNMMPALIRSKKSLHRDPIHLNEFGNLVYAKTILRIFPIDEN